MATSHTICEYQGFYRSTKPDVTPETGREIFPLPAVQFDELEKFVISGCSYTNDASFPLMQICSDRRYGKVIKAQNYVGVIRLKSRVQIEILPKIDFGDTFLARKIFLRMLAAFMQINHKMSGLANIDTQRMPIFEVFIRILVEKVKSLAQRGISGAYTIVSDNERFFKGRLLVTQQIRSNLIHRERFYVAYDVFSRNAPENRLIKTTFLLLRTQTSSTKTKRDIEELLTFIFDEVPESHNVEADLQSTSALRRRNELYDTVLTWCEVFLRQESFTTFTGIHETQALLFPMEKLFEAYVAKCFRTHAPKGWRITAQGGHKMLFDRINNDYQMAFMLQPDLIMAYHGKPESYDVTIIADTKWKRLSNKKPYYGIAQSDMYQMYAYQKKFTAKTIHLIYPKHKGADFPDKLWRYGENEPDGVDIRVNAFDLELDLHDSKYRYEFVKNLLMEPENAERSESSAETSDNATARCSAARRARLSGRSHSCGDVPQERK